MTTRVRPPPAISTSPRSSETAHSPMPSDSSSANTASSTAPSMASVMSPPSPRPPSRSARWAASGKRSRAALLASAARRENASQSASGASGVAMGRRILGPMPPRADGLSEVQLRGVAHRGGPLLILGGAGTGKSRVLCERFTHLVESGTPPGAVLSLALTPGAAARMRERVEAAIETPFEELWVETFEGFCARLLRDEALEAGLDPFFAPVTQADRLALLLERIDDLTLRRHEIRGNPAPLLASFLTRIDRLKEEMVSPAEYQAYAERLSREAVDDATRARARRELEFAGLYADHDALLADRGALDSGGLVLHAFELLHRKPHVRARVAARFAHVLVDDFQDVTFSESALLRLLAEEPLELTVAADDDQAIRRDGRAASKNVLDFQREHPEATVVKLDRSQRCARQIVQAACAVVAPAPGRVEKKLRGRGTGSVRFWQCRSERAEAQQVAAEAERLIAASGVPAEEVCVLVPSVQTHGQVVGSALEER